MAKWDNMLKIVWLLRSDTTTTADQLSEELEISVRTVYRYIDALCASGVPIIAEAGHEGGYSLPHTFRQAPLFFDTAELKAFLHAALFAQGAGYPFEDDLKRALQKIQLYHREKQPEDWLQQARGMDVVPTAKHQQLKQMLQLLEKSVLDQLVVRVQYAKSWEAPSEVRMLQPYGLAYRADRWYLIAFCQLREDVRTFRVDRIEQLYVTEHTFQAPTDFSIKAYLEQQSPVEELTDTATCTVLIEGESASMKSLSEHWYLRHYVAEQGEHTLLLRMDEEIMLKHLPSFLLTYTSTIRAVEPPSLKEAVAKIVKELADYYI